MRLISRVRKKFRQSTSQISTYKIEELYIEGPLCCWVEGLKAPFTNRLRRAGV